MRLLNAISLAVTFCLVMCVVSCKSTQSSKSKKPYTVVMPPARVSPDTHDLARTKSESQKTTSASSVSSGGTSFATAKAPVSSAPTRVASPSDKAKLRKSVEGLVAKKEFADAREELDAYVKKFGNDEQAQEETYRIASAKDAVDADKARRRNYIEALLAKMAFADAREELKAYVDKYGKDDQTKQLDRRITSAKDTVEADKKKLSASIEDSIDKMFLAVARGKLEQYTGKYGNDTQAQDLDRRVKAAEDKKAKADKEIAADKEERQKSISASISKKALSSAKSELSAYVAKYGLDEHAQELNRRIKEMEAEEAKAQADKKKVAVLALQQEPKSPQVQSPPPRAATVQPEKKGVSARVAFKMKNDDMQTRFLGLARGRDKASQELTVVKGLLADAQERLSEIDTSSRSKKSSVAADARTSAARTLFSDRIRTLTLLLQEKEVEHSEYEKMLSTEFGVVKDRKYQYDPEKKTLYELIQASE